MYNVLLEMYREVYKHIGFDFNTMEKEEGFFYLYEIDREEEDSIISRVLANHKLTVLQKKCLKMNYYLGCSPKSKV